MFVDDLLVQDLDENLHEEKVLGTHDSIEEDSIGQVENGALVTSSILENTGSKTTHTYYDVGTQTSADISIETSQGGVLLDGSIVVPRLWMLEALVVDVQESGARTVKFRDGLRVVGSGAQSCSVKQDLGGCTVSGGQPKLFGEEDVLPGCAGESLLVDLDEYEFGVLYLTEGLGAQTKSD